MKAQRNDAIQGLRGIAALLVVVAHSILNLIQRAHYDPQAAELAYRLAELGVKMFFIISGFIMTTTMFDSFGRRGAPANFISKRLLRIVPIYWLATLIYAVKLSLGGNVPRWDELILSLCFIPYNHGQPMGEPVYGLGWTLNYEMFFYYQFTLVLFLRRGPGLGLLLAVLVGLVAVGHLRYFYECSGQLCTVAQTFTHPIISYFAGGIVLGLCRRWLQTRGGLPRIDTRAAMVISITAVCAYAAIVSYALVPAGSGAATLAQVLACGIATTVCTLERTPDGSAGRIRSLLLILGNASYSIYLTHSFLMGSAARTWILASNGPESNLAAVGFVVLMIIGASLLGVITYRFVERPLLDLLRSRFTGDRQAVA